MARIEMVKSELFKYVGLFDAEMYYQLPLRLAFMALLTCCDRQGRFRWDPSRLTLDPKQRRLIQKALSFGYDVQALCDVITGCSLTPHNQGHSDRNQRYDGLYVILRDNVQIDRFIHNAQYPPRLMNEAEKRTQANVSTLQSWIVQKLAQGESHGNA